MIARFLFPISQVTKAKPNDKDARAKYNECNKIVRRIAFEKAISVEDTQKSIADQINLDSMSMFQTELLFISYKVILLDFI